MKKLLCIQASPRQEDSRSRRVAEAFIDEYRRNNPDDSVSTMDLFRLHLPGFDGKAVQARYNILRGTEHSPEEAFVWEGVESIVKEFVSADKYVFATPMWNFGIPYKLKQYIDILVQPGYTFTYSREQGYRGLVTGKPALVIAARGDSYPLGTEIEEYDFQSRYLDAILRFMGFSDIQHITIENTSQENLGEGESIEKALRQAKDLVSAF